MRPMVAKAAAAIEPSRIRRMFNKALEYDEVISFTVGEPDFTAAAHVVEAGRNALAQGLTRYSENAGVLALRNAIADDRQRELGLGYDPQKEIVVTTGGMGALYLCLKVILEPGDEVILSTPSWTNYTQQIRMCQGVPVNVKAQAAQGFLPDLAGIREALTERTRAILINSPANPTGAVIPRAQLEELAALAQEKDLLVLSDEVYKHILFTAEPYTSIAQLAGMKERTVVIDSLSKSHAMTGYRIGYAAGPEVIIRTMIKLQENTTACAATPCQYAAAAALNGPDTHLKHMVTQYQKRRDYLVTRIGSIPRLSCQEPQGAFYAFVSIGETGLAADEFADRLLAQQQVVVVPGTAFGEDGEGYIRLSFATSLAEIQQGLDKLEAFVRGLD